MKNMLAEMDNIKKRTSEMGNSISGLSKGINGMGSRKSEKP